MGEWPQGLLEKCKRRVGVMGVVEREGYVQAGYGIYVEVGEGGGKLGSI